MDVMNVVRLHEDSSSHYGTKHTDKTFTKNHSFDKLLKKHIMIRFTSKQSLSHMSGKI
jgi:hypothetical protein